MLHRPSVFIFIPLLHLKVGFAVMRNLRIGGFEKVELEGRTGVRSLKRKNRCKETFVSG